ncbi:TMEM165/GDT1 family protein [Sporohalobacter salinus]|uniref:TMEM165/GDT1 family protein n=1 Tax=Sporohalobacter salinus TaxID=1494606 RepID=UPI00195FF33B|nr:TMEM165/GDT1 family protein [Sporohalobacter salinus]MBM7624135.1 putative Ca2+/H+ antiporter (TMEM165/GDT1 family) [Sporohalobacter salinus]
MNWKLFFTTYAMLFLAELGDKTQLAVFTLVTQNESPIPIFLGASAALITVTLLAAFFGDLITKYVPESYLQLGAGVIFIVIGIFVLKDALGNLVI